MADADAPLVEKKHRKSVAFSEGTTIMDANGAISEASHSDDKTTAERHSATSLDKEVDEVTELFKGLSKKKKTKKTKDSDAEPNADGEFDPSMMKKKKKSSKKAADGDFEAKLAEAGLASEETAPEEKPSTEEIVSDIENGRGIWAHNATQPIPYNLLVTRFFTLIHSHHPDILSSGSKSYKIPPPQCLREVEYVTCKTCRSPRHGAQTRERTVFIFVTCNSCGSRRFSHCDQKLASAARFMVHYDLFFLLYILCNALS
ncbi:eukaryotic translation initiation factor 2 beta subunit [Histoplasma capsulatum H143]|uniref:Eukaryotic translation initiation factor 2 beta subunit n=1 Tax=Ajellomyces capsulatus (strain H143) TaxID=544712 RepID=C6H472_AJECH|nr:eukaryotic translation initiation factor 2 beta subunit [Histoplasma capsulatum H143]